MLNIDPLFVSILLVISAILAFISMKKGNNNQEVVEREVVMKYQNIILSVQFPKESEKSTSTIEDFLALIHGLGKITPAENEHLSFEVVNVDGKVNFFIGCPPHLMSFLLTHIKTLFPLISITQVNDYLPNILNEDENFVTSYFSQKSKYYFPIKTYQNLSADTMNNIISGLTLQNNGVFGLMLLLKPLSDNWQEEANTYVGITTGKIKPIPPKETVFSWSKSVISEITSALREMVLDVVYMLLFEKSYEPKQESAKEDKGPSESVLEGAKLVGEKARKMGFSCNYIAYCISEDIDEAKKNIKNLKVSFDQINNNTYNSLIMSVPDLSDFDIVKSRGFRESRRLTLTTDEIATIFHFPSKSLTSPNINWKQNSVNEISKKLTNIPSGEGVLVAKGKLASGFQDFYISKKDRVSPLMIIGKAGSGKSTLLSKMVSSEIDAQQSIIIDPTGDLAKLILSGNLNRDKIELIDFGSTEFIPACNIFEKCSYESESAFLANHVKFWLDLMDEEKNHRLELLLTKIFDLIYEIENTTILSVLSLLLDEEYRTDLISTLPDTTLKEFWKTEYPAYFKNNSIATDTVLRLQTFIQNLLSSDQTRMIICQARSKYNLDKCLEEGKSVVITCIDSHVSNLHRNYIFSTIIHKLQLSLAKINLDNPVSLIIDDIELFYPKFLSKILMDSRKHRFMLTFSSHNYSILDELLRKDISSYISQMIIFGLSSSDAKILKDEMLNKVTEYDLMTLDSFNFYAKLVKDGQVLPPFLGKIERDTITENNFEKNRSHLISRSGIEKKTIETRINNWINKRQKT